MKLSDLKTGERGVIVKVMGHGGFRKRIVEMGFIKGKVVDVLQNAPLHDPVKYKLMGYEVSLRHSEADMIEVISVEEAERIEKENKQHKSNNPSDTYDEAADNAPVEDKSAPNPTPLTEGQLRDAAMKKRRTINVALVGNPNCGKTSLFNFASGAHERVGNYSGVTVDAKVGHAEFEGYEFNIVDLPGTYSLSAYSPEELYVRKQIIENTPDVIINVIDTSNLERNLYLTTQLIDMHLRMVCALNMFDETEKRGDNVDYAKLGELFGVTLHSIEEIATYAKKLQEMGAQNVLISMAGDGALLIDETGKQHVCGVCKGTVKNSVGAGDSMVAGFVAGSMHGDYEAALKLGTAAGGATAFSEGLAQRAEIERLLQQL